MNFCVSKQRLSSFTFCFRKYLVEATEEASLSYNKAVPFYNNLESSLRDTKSNFDLKNYVYAMNLKKIKSNCCS